MFIRKPRSLYLAHAGTTITLSCKVDGHPKPTLIWLRGYTVINFSKTTNLQLLPDGSMRFSPVTKADQDTYRCVAENRNGLSSASSRLWVGSW